MIFVANQDRSLKYETPLIDYLKKNHHYSMEKLLFSDKYTAGSFTVATPSSDFTNCEFVNGYPHFHIPVHICMDEINFFKNHYSLYQNHFIIRYGDSHPHNPIPKLGQTRNLIIADCLAKMIGTHAKEVFAIGDISIKSLRDFVHVNSLEIDSNHLLSMLLNHTVKDSIINDLELYDYKAIEGITNFINCMDLSHPEYLLESSLYANQDYYHYLKTAPQFSEYLKDNGEIKYTLQEFMFIHNIISSDKDVLINVIGADQSDHIQKVNHIIEEEKMDVHNRFLSYGICKNGLEKDISIWSSKLESFIEKNHLKIGDRYITYSELLKILFIINNNDVIIDFDNLNKHLVNIKRLCSVYSDQVINKDEARKGITNIEESHLLCKMSLVNYTLNKAIEMGEANHFYKYILGIINEYKKNPEKYVSIQEYYNDFLEKCFNRLGLFENTSSEERGERYVLSKKI